MSTQPSSTAHFPTGPRMSRRSFMQCMAAAAATTALPHAHAGIPAPLSEKHVVEKAADAVPLALNVNGRQYQLELEPCVTLLDTLRERIGLTGTKKGCDRGQCGACTVLINGRRINSCLTLAIMHEGDEITTVEGLAQMGRLSAMQTAFIEHDAFQCGYCTPGQICSAAALMAEAAAGTASAATPDVRQLNVRLTDDEIRERMSGNLCRCGAYQNIVAAIRAVQDRNG